MDEFSDSDVDSEGVLEELERIEAVLEADEQIPSIAVSQITSVASSSGATFPLPSSSIGNRKDLNKIEEALELNRLMDAKYQRLENMLTIRLQECQEKLKEIGNATTSQEQEVTSFRYHQCGRPYFKDKHNFPAPPNEDTIVMQKTHMYDFSTLITIPGWTVNDKTTFTNIMLKMSQEIKVKELLASIAELKRESTKTGKDNDREIKTISKEIINVKTKPLADVALPLDKEYDWETLANKLNNRHVTSEYRAFWKLFFHPSINKRPWSKNEHKKLRAIACKNNYEDWDQIAEVLNTNRTGYQCFVYFRTNVSTTSNGKKWTPEEVEYLKRLIDFYKEDNYIPWTRVASTMENRTKIQIYNKYLRLQEERKGRFLPEEDAVILNCHKKFGADFKKISEFLPGRSIHQIRIRYNIICHKNLSVIWTVEEDRKLLQFMSNEDSETFFANATKLFPGKSRAHIRSRYITLVTWMRKNPHWDVEYAPRRGARRLPHGAPNDNLSKAVEDLELKIKSEVNFKKSNRITKNSTEKEIDDAIICHLVTELTQEEDSNRIHEDSHASINMSSTEIAPETSSARDLSLRSILLLLNSRLNPNLFKDSLYSHQHPNLQKEKVYTSEKLDCVIKVRSYSRKIPPKTEVKKSPDIWGNSLLGPLSYVLPPHYATITGCKALMSTIDTLHEPECSIAVWMRRNTCFKNQMTLLMERFSALFTWPMILSNVEPKPKKAVSSHSNECVVAKEINKKKRFTTLAATSNVTIPPVAKKYLINPTGKKKKNNSIDLTPDDDDKITLDPDFTL